MSYLENALRKEGLSTSGTKKEKLERLEQCHQRRSPGKQPAKLSRKEANADVASAKLTASQFFEKHRPGVSKTFTKQKDITKELKRLYKEYEKAQTENKKSTSDVYEVLDEKLDDTFASNRGLRCLNPSGPGPFYYKKDGASDTTSPAKSKAATLKSAEGKVVVSDAEADDDEEEEDNGSTIAHSLLVNFFKQRSIHQNTLKLLAQECGKAISGKKEILAGRIADSIVSFTTGDEEEDDEEDDEEEEDDDDEEEEDNDDDEEEEDEED